MNTNHTPRSLLALCAALSMGIVACDGGSASMSVADGIVTETHEVMSADGLVPAQVELTYPEERLADIGHAGVILVPRTRAPYRGIEGLGAPTVRPRHAKTVDGARPRLVREVPGLPDDACGDPCGDPVPSWMTLRMAAEVAVYYEVRLLADGPTIRGAELDERLEGARARR